VTIDLAISSGGVLWQTARVRLPTGCAIVIDGSTRWRLWEGAVVAFEYSQCGMCSSAQDPAVSADPANLPTISGGSEGEEVGAGQRRRTAYGETVAGAGAPPSQPPPVPAPLRAQLSAVADALGAALRAGVTLLNGPMEVDVPSRRT